MKRGVVHFRREVRSGTGEIVVGQCQVVVVKERWSEFKTEDRSLPPTLLLISTTSLLKNFSGKALLRDITT